MASKTHLGRYEVKGKLGKGAMALVLRGYDPHFKRDVAIKVLHRKFGNSPAVRQRFVREARTIAAIDHPAIVPVLDAGQDDGLTFVVLRLMEGGSLHERIQQRALTPEEIQPILERVGAALDAAHERGIIHRDLKPENILFDQYGEAYLGDFGIVKIQDQAVNITQNALVGTPAYMSPEQVRGDVDIDGRSDLYSLGAVLFEMLTGELPFAGDTSMQMAMRHITEPVPRLHDFSRPWQKLIDKAMAKEREKRFQTGAELAAAFAATADHSPTPLIPARQRRNLSFALAGLLALCFLIWGLWGRFGTTEATESDPIALTTAFEETAAAQAALDQQLTLAAQLTQSAAAQALDDITLTAVYAEIAATLAAEPTLPAFSTGTRPNFAEDDIGIVYTRDNVSTVKERDVVNANGNIVVVQIDDELGEDLTQYASFYTHNGTEILYDRAARQRMDVVLSAGSDLYIDAGKYVNGIDVLLASTDAILFSFDQCVSLQHTPNELTANCYGGSCRYETPIERGTLVAGQQLRLDTTLFLTTTRPIPLQQGQADRAFILGSADGVIDAERCLDGSYMPPPTTVPTRTPRPTNTARPAVTNTPLLTALPANVGGTNTPRPANTNTPRPASTNTPRPANTPRPNNTNTPRPTNTLRPGNTPPTNTPRPQPTNTPRPGNTSPPPTNTPRPANTNTPRPQPTSTPLAPTKESKPTVTPIPPTNTPIPPTNTPIPKPTETPTPRPTNTPIPPTNTPTPRPTNTPIPPTNTPTPRPTNTPIPKPTETPTPLPTNTPIPKPTETPIPKPTDTPMPLPTSTALPTLVKPTNTPPFNGITPNPRPTNTAPTLIVTNPPPDW